MRMCLAGISNSARRNVQYYSDVTPWGKQWEKIANIGDDEAFHFVFAGKKQWDCSASFLVSRKDSRKFSTGSYPRAYMRAYMRAYACACTHMRASCR